MLKKLVLVILFGISNLYAVDVSTTGFIQNIKKSPTMVKLFGVIVPCIVVFISMDAVVRAYKDNPKLSTAVNIAYHIKGISFFIATIFSSWLLRSSFREWVMCRAQKSASKFNTPI